jgi:hypothetical protein
VTKFLQHTALYTKPLATVHSALVTFTPLTAGPNPSPATGSMLSILRCPEAFLTETAQQTEITVSYSKQKSATFLTETRIGPRDLVFALANSRSKFGARDNFWPVP